MSVNLYAMILDHGFTDSEAEDILSLLEHTGGRLTDKVREMIYAIAERRASRNDIMRRSAQESR